MREREGGVDIKTILVVEDYSSILQLSTEVLENEGYKVLAATNGQEALDLANNPQIENPDLILLDSNMPVMNGGEFY